MINVNISPQTRAALHMGDAMHFDGIGMPNVGTEFSMANPVIVTQNFEMAAATLTSAPPTPS